MLVVLGNVIQYLSLLPTLLRGLCTYGMPVEIFKIGLFIWRVVHVLIPALAACLRCALVGRVRHLRLPVVVVSCGVSAALIYRRCREKCERGHAGDLNCVSLDFILYSLSRHSNELRNRLEATRMPVAEITTLTWEKHYEVMFLKSHYQYRLHADRCRASQPRMVSPRLKMTLRQVQQFTGMAEINIHVRTIMVRVSMGDSFCSCRSAVGIHVQLHP